MSQADVDATHHLGYPPGGPLALAIPRVRSKAVYLALAVLPDGSRDILGIWVEQMEGGARRRISGARPAINLRSCMVIASRHRCCRDHSPHTQNS
jgi:hypothetical protein